MKDILELKKILNKKLNIGLSLIEYIEFVYCLTYTYLCMDKRDIKIQKKLVMQILNKFVSQVDLLEIVRTNPVLTIKVYTISTCLNELGLQRNIIYPDDLFLMEKELDFKEYLNLKILDFRYGTCISSECTVRYEISNRMNAYVSYPELIYYRKLNNHWQRCDMNSLISIAKNLIDTEKYDEFLKLFFVENHLKQLLIKNWEKIVSRSSLCNLLLLEVKMSA